MCGIAGYLQVGDQAKKEIDLRLVARSLLWEIQDRGRDATGYAYTEGKGEVTILKAPISARAFLTQSARGDTLLSLESPREMPRNLLLHTRAVTQGNPQNNANNHPLMSKKSGLCLVHNGWLLNDDLLVTNLALETDAEVDSEIILRVIEHQVNTANLSFQKPDNITTGILKMHRKLEGCFSCIMTSAFFDNVMWIWRDGNPLAIGYADNTVLVASRVADLAAVFRRHFRPGSWIAKELRERTLLQIMDGKVKTFTLPKTSFGIRPWSGFSSSIVVEGERGV